VSLRAGPCCAVLCCAAVALPPSGYPALLIPGNAGSYEQVGSSSSSSSSGSVGFAATAAAAVAAAVTAGGLH